MTKTNVLFYGKDFTLREICDDFISLTYSEAFNKSGEFSLDIWDKASYIPEVGEYVLVSERLWYIVEKCERVSGNVKLSGRGLLAIFSRCISSREFAVEYDAVQLIRHLVGVCSSSYLPRTMIYSGYPERASVQTVIPTGEVLSCIESIAEKWSIGLSLYYDRSLAKLVFKMYDRVNRSMGDGVGSAVFLSDNYGTVDDVKYCVSMADYKNRVTVCGATKADGTRYSVTVNARDMDFGDGFDDSAEAVCSGYVSSGIGIGTFSERAGGVTTVDEVGYLSALSDRGREYLAKHRPRLSLTAELPCEIFEAVSVGDICTLFVPRTDYSKVCVQKKKCTVQKGGAKYEAELSVIC